MLSRLRRCSSLIQQCSLNGVENVANQSGKRATKTARKGAQGNSVSVVNAKGEIITDPEALAQSLRDRAKNAAVAKDGGADTASTKQTRKQKQAAEKAESAKKAAQSSKRVGNSTNWRQNMSTGC